MPGRWRAAIAISDHRSSQPTLDELLRLASDAAEAVERFLGSRAPPGSITVSSDAGGCLPCFDSDGRVCRMEVGSSGALLATLRALLERGLPLADALPPFTTNPARLLRLAAKGTIAPGADLVALDAAGEAHTVIVRGEIHVADGRAVRRGMFE